MPKRDDRSALERVLTNSDWVDGCLIWQRCLHKDGYGSIATKVNGKRRTRLAHCVTYEAVVGPIPDGLELDHLCRNRACVYWVHMQPVTHAENIRRGKFAQKKHCVQGHPFSGYNLIIRRRNGREARTCRICQNAAHRRMDERMRRELAA